MIFTNTPIQANDSAYSEVTASHFLRNMLLEPTKKADTIPTLENIAPTQKTVSCRGGSIGTPSHVLFKDLELRLLSSVVGLLLGAKEEIVGGVVSSAYEGAYVAFITVGSRVGVSVACVVGVLAVGTVVVGDTLGERDGASVGGVGLAEGNEVLFPISELHNSKG